MFSRPIAFAITTLGETVNPGPSVAYLVTARAKGRREAWGVVLGISLANILWVALMLALDKRVISVLEGQYHLSLYFAAFGAAFLIFLATGGLIKNLVSLFDSVSAGEIDRIAPSSSQSRKHKFKGEVVNGFWVHFVNPLSLPYYVGVFSTTVFKDPSLSATISIIAVASDLVVYGIYASFPTYLARIKTWPKKIRLIAPWALTTLAYLALVYLAARSYASQITKDGHISLTGLTVGFMLLGFLSGSLKEADRLVSSRRTKDNRLLWRLLALWQSIFGAVAIGGTIFTVLEALDPQWLKLTMYQISALRTCALVSIVLTGTFAYAKARGELQEATNQTSQSPQSLSQRAARWNHPLAITLIIVSCLTMLFLFTDLSGFFVSDAPRD